MPTYTLTGCSSMTMYLIVMKNIDGDYDLCYVEDGTRLSTHSTFNEAAYVRDRLRNLVELDDSKQAWWELVIHYHETISVIGKD